MSIYLTNSIYFPLPSPLPFSPLVYLALAPGRLCCTTVYLRWKLTRSLFCSYRIHLSPGSRRRSTAASRTAMIRSYSGDLPASAKRGSHATLTAQLPPINYPSPPPPPSPPIDPPALEQAYSHLPGPDSPPPLVQANLPTPYADSGSSRSPSPPEYIPAPVQATNDYLPVSNYPLGIAHAQYSDGAPTYQDQSQNALYAFENGSSQSQPAAVDNGVHSNGVQEQTFAYNNSFGDHHSTQHISSSPIEHVQHIDNPHSSSSPPPIQYSPVLSRHSISHISNPQAYSHQAHPYPPASVPPSPISARSSSHASLSGPHTPAYTYDDIEEPTAYHATEANFEPISDASCISAAYYESHGELVTTTYASQLTTDPHHAASYSSRYHSSPPILVPAQERLGHGELQQHAHAHTHPSPTTCMTISAASAQSPLSPYLHHPRPLSGAQPHYHQLPHLSLHPADWGKPHAALPAIHN